jgi:hypothetical protein
MPAPVILFGAFDRHNVGDLLFPHLAAAQLAGREHRFAGLAERDLRALGGHAVQPLHRLAAQGRTQGAHLLHAGGEILTCSARQAAVMLLPRDEVDRTLAYLERHPEAEPAWRRGLLGSDDEMPYVARRDALPGLRGLVFDAVGGVALDTLAPAQHDAVLARLRQADAVGVRDVRTQAALRAAGLDALLLPDPAVLVATLFGAAVHEQAARGPVAALHGAFPQGHLALQLAAEFGDDATLDLAASQLKAVRQHSGLGLVLYRAGAAPWHDDLGLLERLAARFAPHELQVFRSLQLWDVCALLASASAVAGSSLHGWIVAAAFGVPAVGLAKPRDDGKLGAYLHTWAGEAAWPLSGLAEGLRLALEGSSPQARRQRAAQWAQQRHEGLRQLWRPLV